MVLYKEMIINSAAYEDLCDHQILFADDIKKYMSSFELYKKDSIIYCKTDFTPLLFEHIKLSRRKYVLVTHHSDYSIDERWFKLKPPNIIKWYAINPTYKHPDLITIPAGIWTSEGRAYYQQQHKIKWFKENRERLFNKEKDKSIVYCNWNITNPNRKYISEKLKVQHVIQSGLSFKTYCEQMSTFQFVVSPPGNGLDNHRTWEALYMGCYPIVINNYIYDSYDKLPIIKVKDYSEVTYKLLEEYLNKTYDYKMLYLEYWAEKIKSHI